MFPLPESLGLVIIADKDDGEVTDYIIVPTSYVNEVYGTKEELLALGFDEYDIDQILNEEEN